jgi:hypothetical protein
MKKRQIRTCYDSILFLQEVLGEDSVRHQVEGSVMLSVPRAYRQAKNIDVVQNSNSYVKGISRAYREELARVARNFDQNISQEKRDQAVQKITNLSELIEFAQHVENGTLYRSKLLEYDPYLLSLSICRREPGKNQTKAQIIKDKTQTIGQIIEDRIDYMYRVRGLYGCKGGDRTNHALVAEYQLFGRVLEDVLAMK